MTQISTLFEDLGIRANNIMSCFRSAPTDIMVHVGTLMGTSVNTHIPINVLNQMSKGSFDFDGIEIVWKRIFEDGLYTSSISIYHNDPNIYWCTRQRGLVKHGTTDSLESLPHIFHDIVNDDIIPSREAYMSMIELYKCLVRDSEYEVANWDDDDEAVTAGIKERKILDFLYEVADSLGHMKKL